MSDLACAELVELVTAFLDGELDDGTERRVIDHLAQCEGCDRYLDQFRRTVRSLGELPPGGLSADTRTALLAAFQDRSPDRPV